MTDLSAVLAGERQWCEHCTLKELDGKHLPRCRCACHLAARACPPNCECGVLAGLAEVAIKIAREHHDGNACHPPAYVEDYVCDGCERLAHLEDVWRRANARRRDVQGCGP